MPMKSQITEGSYCPELVIVGWDLMTLTSYLSWNCVV